MWSSGLFPKVVLSCLKKPKSVGKREVPVLKLLNVALLLLTYIGKEDVVVVYGVMNWDRILCCDHLDDCIVMFSVSFLPCTGNWWYEGP